MKVIITGLHGSGKQEIADMLEKDGIKVGKLFSNLETNSYNSNSYKQFSNVEIGKIFENKAYIYLNKLETNDKVDPYYEGLTTYDFDNNDVFVMQPNAVLNMNAQVKDVLYVWLDNKKSLRHYQHYSENRNYDFDQEEMLESKYNNEFVEKIYAKSSNVIYFNNEDTRRVKTIIKSIINHPEDTKEYIQNFN